MIYFLGPYVWNATTAGDEYWRAPEGCLHHIDLRPIPAQVLRGTVSGVGLFGMPDGARLGADYRLFGQGVGLTQITPRESDRAVFCSMVGAMWVDGTTLAEWMYTLLTLYADPTGDERVRPLLPTAEGRLGACGIAKKFRLDMPEAVLVKDVLQRDYRAIREEARNGLLGKYDSAMRQWVPDMDFHRRVLDSWGEKYRVPDPENFFIPGDLPKETRLKHQTTLTESFNTSDGPLGPDQTWTVLSGTIAVVSQTAEWTGGVSGSIARVDSDLSSTDHYCQCDIVQNGGGNAPGPLARKDSTATLTYYHARGVHSGTAQLYKVVANAFTSLGSAAISVSLPDTVKVECNGSTIAGYYNGTSFASVTDTAISAGLRGGIRSFINASPVPRIDDWEAADLGGGGGGSDTNPGWYSSKGGWW